MYLCGAKFIIFTTNQTVHTTLKIKQCPRVNLAYVVKLWTSQSLGALPFLFYFNFLHMRSPVKNESKPNNSTFTFTADSRNESNLSLQSFIFNQFTVRIFINEKRDPEFCAADVCAVLGYSNSRDAIKKHCKLNGVAKRDTLTSRGKQSVVFLSEGNLYRLIIKSNKPEAEPFESWVCDEVLPTIRKTGSYQTTPVKFYATIIDYWKGHNQALDRYKALTLDIECSRLSSLLGYEPFAMQLPGLGRVRTYHVDILDLIFKDNF